MEIKEKKLISKSFKPCCGPMKELLKETYNTHIDFDSKIFRLDFGESAVIALNFNYCPFCGRKIFEDK